MSGKEQSSQLRSWLSTKKTRNNEKKEVKTTNYGLWPDKETRMVVAIRIFPPCLLWIHIHTHIHIHANKCTHSMFFSLSFFPLIISYKDWVWWLTLQCSAYITEYSGVAVWLSVRSSNVCKEVDCASSYTAIVSHLQTHHLCCSAVVGLGLWKCISLLLTGFLFISARRGG